MRTPTEFNTFEVQEGFTHPQFDDLRIGLQAYQSNRMSQTYSDLKENPDYYRIGKFFFDQIYGPKDFRFRDNGIRKLHQALEGRIDGNILSAVDMVFDLQELSEELDDRLVERMIIHGYGAELSSTQYETIYRDLDNFDQRMAQIELATDSVLEFHRFSKKWFVGVSLKTARSASRLMGLGRIMDFVYEGYLAFRSINDIQNFTDTIRSREEAFNKYIWPE